ncbi:hypothetical protein HYPDE_34078 [Hyphomicrobium denitrificans 1NES1]|uniref:DUF5655 domain-containing protein n=1 Tax=Hyphomicrobium denitrificans 1NES1 TaxID=670307 RepID=N0B663_9HYPH|nr:hypothetical protein [Hyphomicrobium denitrificans]AGK58488.1 hypothetical protein HYPDE_34078 [Hyphomicrobium denitrificans 1NES1]
MSTDYAEMERDFVASLKEDTGRDLAGWMVAIKECGHSDRNAIIDWLRHQGFQFSWASWLERIHHNGGRLIYADDIGNVPPSARLRPPDVTAHDPHPFQNVQGASPPSIVTKPAPPRRDIERLLADAKGLRPLADLVLREVGRTVPDVAFHAKGSFIAIGAPQTFAALLPSPKALRLYANFGTAGVHRAEPADAVNKSASTFPDVLVLDDARSIDEDFLRLIRIAARL